MDTLTLFTQLPVQAEQYYLTGMYIMGAPGFDFLMPIGSSGVAIAAAFNPCIGEGCWPLVVVTAPATSTPLKLPALPLAGDYVMAFSGLFVGFNIPTPGQ